jgi:hypothetical protein
VTSEEWISLNFRVCRSVSELSSRRVETFDAPVVSSDGLWEEHSDRRREYYEAILGPFWAIGGDARSGVSTRYMWELP